MKANILADVLILSEAVRAAFREARHPTAKEMELAVDVSYDIKEELKKLEVELTRAA
jgi:DNA-directed RNA polymerase subunit L